MYTGRYVYLALLVSMTMLFSCSQSEFTECCFIDDDDLVIDQDTTIKLDTCWSSPIVSAADTIYTSYFKMNGPGWTGADGTLSIPLPDGRVLWLFGDTFLGTVQPDLTRTQFTFVNNTVLIQTGDQFQNPIQGNISFATPEETGWWYWPGHGQVIGDTLELIWYAMKQEGEGMWGFEYAAIDVLKYTLPDLQLTSRTRVMHDPIINFGTCLLADGAHTYIYGAEKSGLNKYFHVARIEAGASLSADWQFYDGRQWVDDHTKSRRQGPDVSEQYSVFKYQDQYYLLTQHHVLGDEIYLYQSNEPYKSFSNRQLIYCTPETKGDIFTYNAFAHTHEIRDGHLLVSYNVNSLTFQDVLNNANNYRPKFFLVSGWAL